MILEKIRETLPEMAPLNRKIASYILDHGQSVGLSSIYAMSEKIGVSNASLIRFARSIGMKGYSDLKHALQEEIKQRLSPYEKIASSELGTLPGEARLRKMIQNEENNLRRTLAGLELETLEGLATAICKANKVFISGFGVSRHLAHVFEYSLLGTLNAQVTVISGSVSDFTPSLKAFGPKDIMILLTFPPYSDEGLTVASFARKRGGKLFLFTNSAQCPVYPIADAVVTCENNSLLLSNSFVGLVAVLQLLVNMVCLKDKNASMKIRREVVEMERRGYESAKSPEKRKS